MEGGREGRRGRERERKRQGEREDKQRQTRIQKLTWSANGLSIAKERDEPRVVNRKTEQHAPSFAMFNYVFEALISLEESRELTFASITNRCFAEVVILIFSCKQGYVDASLYLSAYLFSGKHKNALFFAPKQLIPEAPLHE